MKSTDHIVPKLNEDVGFYPFNGSEYLVQHNTLKHQVNINQETLQLLNLVDGKRTIKKIADIYLANYHKRLSSKVIYTILYDRLAKYGFIEQDEYEVEKRQRASYLKLSFVIFSQNQISYLTKPLTFLFEQKTFYTIIASIIAGGIIVLNLQTILVNIDRFLTLNLILYLLVFQVSTLLHELGHASACRRFGAMHGGIGFGFYLLTPVFFADVSDAWKLKPQQRIIVNLGGIYMEMLFSSGLLIAYLITGQVNLLLIPCLLISGTLYNLNPLLRFDGYWVLADMTSIPNLQKKSFESLKNKWRSLKDGNISFADRNEILLVLYALASAIFIFMFLSIVLLYDSNSIFQLPFNLYSLVQDWKSIQLPDIKQLIIPLIFWYLIFKLFFKYGKKWFNTLGR
jgi:putative peptide zinc metalloprotease protein